MFVVRPLEDKKLQKSLCKELGVKYHANALAYYAADLTRDLSGIERYIGICQFVMGKSGEIIALKAADGREDDEAMIVMLRCVMSFMDRCGIKEAVFDRNAASEFLLNKSGFVLSDGQYRMDLDLFYTSPCAYSKKDIQNEG